MATPRQLIADQLRTDQPDYKVHAFPYLPSEVGTDPVVSVWRTDLAPSPDTPNLLRHSLELQAIVGPALEERAEAAGDDVLDEVMLSLQRVPGVAGVTAQRTTFAEKFQGWLVKFHVESENVYKSQVRTERA